MELSLTFLIRLLLLVHLHSSEWSSASNTDRFVFFPKLVSSVNVILSIQRSPIPPHVSATPSSIIVNRIAVVTKWEIVLRLFGDESSVSFFAVSRTVLTVIWLCHPSVMEREPLVRDHCPINRFWTNGIVQTTTQRRNTTISRSSAFRFVTESEERKRAIVLNILSLDWTKSLEASTPRGMLPSSNQPATQPVLARHSRRSIQLYSSRPSYHHQRQNTVVEELRLFYRLDRDLHCLEAWAVVLAKRMLPSYSEWTVMSPALPRLSARYERWLLQWRIKMKLCVRFDRTCALVSIVQRHFTALVYRA